MIIASSYMNKLVIDTFGLKNPPRPQQVPPIFYIWEPDKAPQQEIDAYMEMMENLVLPGLADILSQWSDTDETEKEKRHPLCTNCGKCR